MQEVYGALWKNKLTWGGVGHEGMHQLNVRCQNEVGKEEIWHPKSSSMLTDTLRRWQSHRVGPWDRPTTQTGAAIGLVDDAYMHNGHNRALSLTAVSLNDPREYRKERWNAWVWACGPQVQEDIPAGEFVHHYRDKWGICRNIITHYLGYKYTVMLAIDPLKTVVKSIM